MSLHKRLLIRSIILMALFILPILGFANSSLDSVSYLSPTRFAVNLKYTGLSYHPGGGENIEHYPRSLDSKDYWVVLVGAQSDVDYIANKFLYIRSSSSLYKDCSDLWAGFFHLGFRANLDITSKLSTRIGIGPTYLWRENWYGKVKGYTKDSFFGDATTGDYQSAFIFYGGDLDVEWKVDQHTSFVLSMIPGYPEVIQNSLGVRYRF